jgi:UDP-N-acetylmuramoyl-tripeptide--D-alanyl-D-alanine ligase
MSPTFADILDFLSVPGMRTAADSAPLGEFRIDSREVAPGDVFVALPGERVDGADYAFAALERGARLVLIAEARGDVIAGMRARAEVLTPGVARTSDGPWIGVASDPLEALQRLSLWWRQRCAATVIGVTGSVGKTTTKEMIAQVLAVRHPVLKTEGNRNNAIGVPLTLLRLRPTDRFAVIEMGMDRRGEIESYCRWALPTVGVVTLVGPVHLESLGSIENIARAKAELVQALPPTSAGGVAVLNADDARVSAMAALTSARVLTFGLASSADVRATDIASHGLNGVSFRLHFAGASVPVHLKLLGRHSVHTALSAAAVALSQGYTLEDVAQGLGDEPTQLRLVVARGPHDSIVLDDCYNASPQSTIAALNLLKDIDGEFPRIAVLGDMLELGDAEQVGHEEVGCRAALVAHRIVCVGERSRIIARAARECGAPAESVYSVATNADAIALLHTLVESKSVILVKGSRGMHMEEIVAALGGFDG